jgi:hypothetical protein
MSTDTVYKYAHLSGAGTTTLLSGIGANQGAAGAPANVGMLAAVNINTAGTSVTIYDNSAGSGTVVGVWGATVGGNLLGVPVQLFTGLTVVIVGAADVTLAYA